MQSGQMGADELLVPHGSVQNVVVADLPITRQLQSLSLKLQVAFVCFQESPQVLPGIKEPGPLLII